MNSLEKWLNQLLIHPNINRNHNPISSISILFFSLHRTDSTLIITEPQLPFAKIVPISNNIYSKLSNHHEQLMLHFQVRKDRIKTSKGK
jgi:hypothetical protein